MKAVRIRVTPELIRQSLQLPEDCNIVNAYSKMESGALYIEMVIESEKFAECKDLIPPLATPIFRAERINGKHEGTLIWREPRKITFDWNIWPSSWIG